MSKRPVKRVDCPSPSYSSSSDSGSESDPPPPTKRVNLQSSSDSYSSESDSPPPTKRKPLQSKLTDQTPKPNSKPRPSKNNEPINESKKGTTDAAGASSNEKEIPAVKKILDNAAKGYMIEFVNTVEALSNHLKQEIRTVTVNEDSVKRGMEMIGVSAAKEELVGQCKELQLAEWELKVMRAEIVINQARLILEAYKSSNH